MITTLRIKKEYNGKLETAIKWFSIVSILNDFKLSPLEIRLLAYTAVEGSISSGGRKEDFCQRFSSTKSSVNNSISKLHKKHFFIKQDGRMRLHPQLVIDVSNILLSLNLVSNEAN